MCGSCCVPVLGRTCFTGFDRGFGSVTGVYAGGWWLAIRAAPFTVVLFAVQSIATIAWSTWCRAVLPARPVYVLSA